MVFKQPKRVKGAIERIVIPKNIAMHLNFSSELISESMGFIYGVKKGPVAYIGASLHKNDFHKKRVNPTHVDFNKHDLKPYSQTHNQICKFGTRNFNDFLQICYHSHPRLNISDLNIEQKRFLIKTYPEFSEDLGSLVENLDNSFLSEEDIDFARKYSSKGLALLSIGESNDARNNRSKSIFLKNMSKYLFGKGKNKLKGFQVKGINPIEIPVFIAEKSDNPKDSVICNELMYHMQPMRDIALDYYKDSMQVVKNNHPKIYSSIISAVSKIPLIKEYKVLDILTKR